MNERSPQFELIQPLDGPSIHADWLEERGEGFQHVAYVVPSLPQITSEMEAAGHPAVARIHAFGAAGDGAAAYFDTVDALGFMVDRRAAGPDAAAGLYALVGRLDETPTVPPERAARPGDERSSANPS